MRGDGMNVSQIARRLCLWRRRIDKWIDLDEVPAASPAGNASLDGIKTTVASSRGGAVEQGTRRVNQMAGTSWFLVFARSGARPSRALIRPARDGGRYFTLVVWPLNSQSASHSAA